MDSSSPASIREISLTRASSRSSVACATVRRATVPLCTQTWAPGETKDAPAAPAAPPATKDAADGPHETGTFVYVLIGVGVVVLLGAIALIIAAVK